MSEINITPFTDVVLVLLVIFMVTTPLILQSGIKVNLPQVQSAEVEDDRNITLTVAPDGGIFIDAKAYTLETLKFELAARISAKPESMIIINGDKDVKYDVVIQILDIARLSGATRYALSTEIKRNK